jgi:hypothetical protein
MNEKIAPSAVKKYLPDWAIYTSEQIIRERFKFCEDVKN